MKKILKMSLVLCLAVWLPFLLVACGGMPVAKDEWKLVNAWVGSGDNPEAIKILRNEVKLAATSTAKVNGDIALRPADEGENKYLIRSFELNIVADFLDGYQNVTNLSIENGGNTLDLSGVYGRVTPLTITMENGKEVNYKAPYCKLFFAITGNAVISSNLLDLELVLDLTKSITVSFDYLSVETESEPSETKSFEYTIGAIA